MSSKQGFINRFPELVQDIIDDIKSTGMPQEAIDWTKKSLEYNVPGGKLNRGISVVDTVKIIRGDAVTEDEIKKAEILGWCVEWLQAFFLVSDDLMDSSITRRGQPCWYQLEGVNLISVNDSFILESCIYKLIKKYFRQEDYYVHLLEVFHEVTYQTELGQLVDLLTAPENDVNLDRFSLEKQLFISTFKTAYYSFYLPVGLALYMCGISDDVQHEKAKEILIPIGQYFQIQDDYLDCYGDAEFIGKIGTDIQDNKCSWLVGQALKRVNEEQRQVLKANYGQKDDAKAQVVKDLYKELNLATVYRDYEESTYKSLIDLINQLDPKILNPEIFLSFLNKIYKRDK